MAGNVGGRVHASNVAIGCNAVKLFSQQSIKSGNANYRICFSVQSQTVVYEWTKSRKNGLVIASTWIISMAGFSERHKYQAAEKPISYREDASANLRTMVVELAEEQGVRPSTLRSIICRELLVSPDPSNWSEYPNVDSECRILLHDCEWFEVYDIIEKIGAELRVSGRYDLEAARTFEKTINKLFIKDGAGWQMIDGEILARGSEPFNRISQTARETLADQHPTAASEIHEAIQDISRRPQPDKTGAVHHAMGAVECVARSLSGEARATLGEIVKGRAKQLGIPAPLDEAISKMWGYASERGRHIREGHEPTFEEAELVVTVASAVCTYLSRKAL